MYYIQALINGCIIAPGHHTMVLHEHFNNRITRHITWDRRRHTPGRAIRWPPAPDNTRHIFTHLCLFWLCTAVPPDNCRQHATIPATFSRICAWIGKNSRQPANTHQNPPKPANTHQNPPLLPIPCQHHHTCSTRQYLPKPAKTRHIFADSVPELAKLAGDRLNPTILDTSRHIFANLCLHPQNVSGGTC